MHPQQPLCYRKETGRDRASPQKPFPSQGVLLAGWCQSPGFEGCGRGFPGVRLEAPTVVLKLAASDSTPVNFEQSSGAQNLAAERAGVSFQSP